MATSSFKKSKDIKGVMRISSNIIDCFWRERCIGGVPFTSSYLESFATSCPI
jgi:hypothetical protein